MRRSAFLAALSLCALATAAAAAEPAPSSPDAPPAESAGTPRAMVDFEADTLVYDEDSDVVTATGNVVVRNEDQKLTADRVVYDRKAGTVSAAGNVLAEDRDGSRVVSDHAELSELLRDGVIDNVLLVLADKGRLAANRATRTNSVTTLDHAVYSPCAVVDDRTGCPQIRSGRSRRCAWSTTPSASGSIIAMPGSRCSGCRSWCCRACRIPKASTRTSPASCRPTSATRANSAANSPFPISGRSGPTST